MECHFDALPCTPFCLFEAFHPPGSVSLDSRVASLPYESSSLATSRGNEKIGGTGYCVTYDTDSQSRNAPCVPFRGRGPRSGEGMYEGKNDMILDMDVTAEGGIIKLIAREGNPPPFEPFEPSEPYEPSRRRRVQWRQPPPQPSA